MQPLNRLDFDLFLDSVDDSKLKLITCNIPNQQIKLMDIFKEKGFVTSRSVFIRDAVTDYFNKIVDRIYRNSETMKLLENAPEDFNEIYHFKEKPKV